jgi:anti-sigma regulatory factor (Ser/Thr protein kinase)
MICQLRFPISEASAVSEVRREASSLAQALRFSETARGAVSIVVTELATNLAKHAVHGEILFRGIERDGVSGLEVLSLDRGPGMANVTECIRDGYSTSGSPGTGLGAVSRLSDEFDIHSIRGKGTALFVRLWSKKLPRQVRRRTIEFGVVCLPKPGETECGDAWHVEWRNNRCLILVADGLGHGPDAALASLEAVRVLKSHSHLNPSALIEFAHGALRVTRGAAMAIAEFGTRSQLNYAGIGNVTGLLRSPADDRHMVSLSGIVGHELRKVQEFGYPWPADSLLIMCTDGLATHWNLDQYPGLLMRHPGLIAGILYRDFARARDDVTVLVGRQQTAI